MIKDKTIKSEIKQQKLLKLCYGTSEWSENSGICRNCKWQEECGKVKIKRKIKPAKK